MAVESTNIVKKHVTNRQSQQKSATDRGSQFSTRGSTTKGVRDGSNPGLDASRNFAVTLKDIDTAIIKHVKTVMKPQISEAGERVNVPVLYANEERWKSVRKNGTLRDKNGSILYPLILVRRTEVGSDDSMPVSMDHDVQHKFVSVKRVKKWSKTNRYDNFSIQNGLKPAYEVLATGMPDFIICTYSFIIFTSYMEQMNYINELFLEHAQKYWGEPEGYKFLASMEGGISDASEMAQDGERIIKSELTVSVKAYVLPEFKDSVFGQVAQMSKHLTTSKVVFGTETKAKI